MIRTSHVAFAVLFLCFSGAASAGEFAYTCEVSHVYSLKENGSLETFPDSELEKIMKKSSFSVSRETGALIGNSVSLDTSLAKSTRVILSGSKENSFRAIADFGDFKISGNHPYQFIEIKEFRKSTKKPFVLMGNWELSRACVSSKSMANLTFERDWLRQPLNSTLNFRFVPETDVEVRKLPAGKPSVNNPECGVYGRFYTAKNSRLAVWMAC